MNAQNKTRFIKASILATLYLFFLATAEASSWPEIFKESTGLEAEQIDPEFGAEILIRWVEVYDEHPSRTDYNYYYRVKVFDERGVDNLKLIKLEGAFGGQLRRIHARIVYPDGRVEEIEKDAIVEKEKIRQGRIRKETASFAPPQLEPGCVIDFQWKHRTNNSAYGYQLLTKMDFPTHTLVFRTTFYRYLDAAWTGKGMDISDFSKPQPGNYNKIVLHDLPAVSDEDYLPPPSELQPSLTIYYIYTSGKNWIEKFWKKYAIDLDQSYRKHTNPQNSLIKSKASELIAEEEDTIKQLQRIYYFCQNEIVNIYDPTKGYTSDELEKMRQKISDVADVMELGYGSYHSINNLFASLAEAAGFSPRLIRLSDRSESRFDFNMAFYGSLPDSAIAIKPDGAEEWMFFCPGNRFLPFGKLHYTNELAGGLLSDAKKPTLIKTEMSPANTNWLVRQGDFTLDKWGELNGSVTLTYRGQYAVIYRALYEDLSTEQKLENLEEEASDQFANFEITNVRLSGEKDTQKPFKITFDIKVEGYADVTSKRLFLAPSFFQKGLHQFFSEPTREFDIEYQFLHTVRDVITIALPDGYTLENPSFKTGALSENYLKHQLSLAFDEEKNALNFKRNYQVNTPGFPLKHYEAIRQIFEAIHDQDNQTLALHKIEDEADTTEDPSTAEGPETASLNLVR